MTRVELLNSLIRLDCASFLETFKQEIVSFAWDVDKPLVQLKISDITALIDRVIQAKLSLETIWLWAEYIESREDIEFDPIYEDKIKSCIFQLANSELSGIRTVDDLISLRGEFV